jgi:hypothetical protein
LLNGLPVKTTKEKNAWRIGTEGEMENQIYFFCMASLPPRVVEIITQLVGRFVEEAAPSDSCHKS